MSSDSSKIFDVVVAGGGIAGLATAEIFARSGYKVALLEKAATLCREMFQSQAVRADHVGGDRVHSRLPVFLADLDAFIKS